MNDDEVRIYLPRNLNYLRVKNNYSRQFLANFLHKKSDVTIFHWENGRNEPNAIELYYLSKLYNISIDDLVTKDLLSGNDNDNDRELKRNDCVNNLKRLTKEQEEEILKVVDVLVQSKMTNLNEKEK